jgi:hypothetical protein
MLLQDQTVVLHKKMIYIFYGLLEGRDKFHTKGSLWQIRAVTWATSNNISLNKYLKNKILNIFNKILY